MLIECPACQSHFVVSGRGEHKCPICDNMCFVGGGEAETASQNDVPNVLDSFQTGFMDKSSSLESDYADLSSAFESPSVDPQPSKKISSNFDPIDDGGKIKPPKENLSGGVYNGVKPIAPPMPSSSSNTPQNESFGASSQLTAKGNCALHPYNEAEGFCSRCGNFLCHECRGMIDGEAYCASCYYKVESESKYILWEDNDPLISGWSKYWGTIKLSFQQPKEMFQRMPTTGGFGRPLLFAMISFISGFFVLFGFQFLLLGGGFLFTGIRHIHSGKFVGILVVIILAMLLVFPLMVTIGLYIGSGIYHLCLRIVGGGKEGYEATFRVLCYSSAPYVLLMIPFCGAYVAGIWQLILQIIGARETHKMSGGSVVLAYFMPTLAIIALVIVVAMIFVMAR